MKTQLRTGRHTSHCRIVLLVLLAVIGVMTQFLLLGDAVASHGFAGWSASISIGQHKQQQQDSGVTSLRSSPAASIRPFVGVLSSPGNFQARAIVRDTWGSDKRVARLMFFTLRPESAMLFRQLRREAVELGDVVIAAEVLSHHHNITYSTYEIFKTAARIGGFTHVVKTDDDCYVRWDLLLPALANMPAEWLYAGWPMQSGRLDRKGRYAVAIRSWPLRKTARYAYGWGYVVSMDIANEIAAGAPLLIMEPGNLLALEDVAVGYWVLAVGGDRKVDINYETFQVDANQNCSDKAAVVHLQPPAGTPWDMMQCMFQNEGQCCNCTDIGGCVAANGWQSISPGATTVDHGDEHA